MGFWLAQSNRINKPVNPQYPKKIKYCYYHLLPAIQAPRKCGRYLQLLPPTRESSEIHHAVGCRRPPTQPGRWQLRAPPRLGQRELRDLLVRGPVLPMPSAVGAMLAGAVSSFTMQGVSSSGEVGY